VANGQEFALQRMLVTASAYVEDPPTSEVTGFTILDPRHPDAVAPGTVLIPLTGDSEIVLWKGALG